MGCAPSTDTSMQVIFDLSQEWSLISRHPTSQPIQEEKDDNVQTDDEDEVPFLQYSL